jgi:subfamily B ATP-binding cassette protein MsbA
VTLLTGVLKPTGGTISLGDTDYSEINQKSLRQGIGYVTQETVIFNDTIKNNITLSNNSVPDEKVMAAANRAFLMDFIEALPGGFDTVMGDDGVNISGGQRQRISIARELFKDAKLLMFDEATSSLDSHSEREIQRNIEGVRGEKTVVIIAHRLSTVKASDMIFVLDKGAVAEQGTYDELYSRGGLFKAMVDQQSLSDIGDTPKPQASGDRT